MDDRGPFPRSAVRRLPRDSEQGASAVTEPPKVAAELGEAARSLHDALLQDPRSADVAHLREFAGALARSLPLSAADRQALARVLSVPESMALRWIQDAVMVLRDPEPLLESREGLILCAMRLDTLAWAWGDVPEAWPRAHEEQVARAWAAELAAPLNAVAGSGDGADHRVP